MSNYADYVDSLSARDNEPQTELARTRIALAEAHRINRELVRALEELVYMADPHDKEQILEFNRARAILKKVNP